MNKITRKIVDSNYLQDNDLEVYLSSDLKNFAVLTDYTAMEAYKGDTLKSIFKSMDILSKYPNQVIMLKGTRVISGLISNKKNPVEEFIDPDQTNGFPNFCKILRMAQKGHRDLERQLLSLGEEASAHMLILQKEAEGIISAIKQMTFSYSDEELRILRKCQPWTKSIAEKYKKNTLWQTSFMIEHHPDIDATPKFGSPLNTYIYRYAVCAQLWVIDWISKGGFQDVRLDKMRNDVVDLHYVACATFFDGLLTRDKKAGEIYTQAMVVLDFLSSNSK